MPDGWNQMFGLERYRAAEGLFDAKAALTDSSNLTPPASQTLPAIIQTSLSQVDVDIRPHLLSNIVITGGASLMQGFTDRLTHEISTLYPGPRVRVTAAGNLYERKYASWIGGSILASLGTFHQVCPVLNLSLFWLGKRLIVRTISIGKLEKGVRRKWSRANGST